VCVEIDKQIFYHSRLLEVGREYPLIARLEVPNSTDDVSPRLANADPVDA
jgi:hypothetical protein